MTRHEYTFLLCAGLLGLCAGFSCVRDSKNEAASDVLSGSGGALPG